MKKITRLTENDLTRLVKKVIKEESWKDYNKQLKKLESNLNNIKAELLEIGVEVDKDERINEDDKKQLIEYAESLYSLLKPLETLDSLDYPRNSRR